MLITTLYDIAIKVYNGNIGGVFMQAKDIIKHFEDAGPWVNRQHTRDVVLAGNPEIEVKKVGVCWMMTNKALKLAIDAGVNFIITHENPFYEASTVQHHLYSQSAHAKRMLLEEHSICLYRCHDLWDRIPEVGIADIWARTIGLSFEKRKLSSYNSYAHFPAVSVKEIAKKVAAAVAPYGQQAVQLYGDPEQLVSSLVIGTGAAIDVNNMLMDQPVDAIVTSEDGCKSYEGVQYCLDNNIPVICVNHAQSEMAGLESLVDYLKQQFDVPCEYLPEGYETLHVKAE